MMMNKCRCGGIPKIIMKIPKKRELCCVVCDKCGAKTDFFMAEYQAVAVWNSLMGVWPGHYESQRGVSAKGLHRCSSQRCRFGGNFGNRYTKSNMSGQK